MTVLAKPVQLLGHGWDRQRWGGAERMAQRAFHQTLAPQRNPHSEAGLRAWTDLGGGMQQGIVITKA